MHLVTFEDKKRYLEQILIDDQRVRQGDESTEIILNYGYDSEEYLDYSKSMVKQDEINFMKVEKYLEIHGYPDKKFGSSATTAPWMVIHHSQGYDVRERNFEKVYEAYLKGDIDDGAISFYLGRMHQLKCGYRYRMENPYRAEDEINILITELNLEKQMATVEQKLQ